MRDIRNPQSLVSTGWLANRLDDPDLRVFDCSTLLQFEEGGKRPYRVLNCAAEHEAGHIPGASHFDLQHDFPVDDCPFGMTLTDPDTVAASVARTGIDNLSRFILYNRRSPSWATRFWWMLRWLGINKASVLDRGFDKWVAEGRPLSTETSTYPGGHLSIRLRPDLFVAKDEVLAAISEPGTCLVNALGRDILSGENPRYGRPGRIPGSVCLPQVELLDPESHEFLPAYDIAQMLESAGADGAERYITCCGGGIFATVGAFWLYQLGHDNVAVYENSMSEWGPDKTLPIETG